MPRGWASVAPELKHVLRLGAFQLTALDRVPPHAAVDTSVALAKAAVGARAGGFVNAVLRRLGRSEPAATSSRRVLGRRGWRAPPRTLPGWSSDGSSGSVHEETVELLRWNNTRPRLVLQPAREPQADAGGAAGARPASRSSPAPFGAGLVDRPQPARRICRATRRARSSFRIRPRRCSRGYADLPAGATLYDACAAPGGKTIALGRGLARVIAGDLGQARVRRLAANLRRAGSGREHPIVADARAAAAPSGGRRAGRRAVPRHRHASPATPTRAGGSLPMR